MERKNLSVQERTEFRKSATKRLRKNGKIPAIIYGSKQPMAIILDALEFHREFHTISENTIINLDSGKQKWEVLVKDFQEDLLKGEILHIDFYEIEEGKVLKTRAPVHVEGTAPGIKEGGILQQRLYELEIECVPSDLPEALTVDVSNLMVGDSIHVNEIEIPAGVKVLNIPEQVVVNITVPKAEVEEPEEEEVLLDEDGEPIVEGEEGEEAEGGAEAEGEDSSEETTA